MNRIAVLLAGIAAIASLVVAPAAIADGGGKQKQRGKQEVRMGIFLTGDAIMGVTPEGQAMFRSRTDRSELKVEVEDVNLPGGTALTVSVDGSSVGMITLKRHAGELELRTQDGDTVPTISAGSMITVSAADGTVILSGQF